MQNAGPESPRSRLFPAFAGLALTLLAAAPAAAADEALLAPWAEQLRYAATPGEGGTARPRSPAPLALFGFGLAADASGDRQLRALGLAFRLGGGVSLGAGGGIDPAGGGKIALVVLEIAF